MIFVRLIRFFKGYVNFICYGGFPERFINLCNINGIILHNTKTEKNTIYATTDIASFRKIRQCVKNSGMKLKITKKGGLPFILNRYKRRTGLLTGITASILLVSYLSGFIWITEVKGNDSFTENQIIEICRKYGISQGTKKSTVNVSSINNRIKNDFENISWFALNIYGSTATLEVSERTDITNIYDKNTPCNIVSGEDGVVIELITLSGTPAIKTGSAVTEGDLLISGVIQKTDGSEKFIHARGSAKIRTDKTLTASVDNNINVKRKNNRKTYYDIKIFGLKIPLYLKKINTAEKYTYTLSFRNKLLPVSVTKHTSYDFSSEKLTISQQQAKLLAAYNITTGEKEMMQNASFEKKTVKTEKDSIKTVITAEYIIHKTTGIEKFFEVDIE